MFEMTSSLLKSFHFLTWEHGMVSKGGVNSCSSFTPRDWAQLGQTIPPLPDFTPSLALLGFEHKPDHLRSSSRIVHHCIATDLVLPRLHWDIWSYSGCHLFLKRDRSQNWDPWYAHLSAALVAARHVMWQTKLCTQYYLKFPIKDEQKECVRGEGWLGFSMLYNMCHSEPIQGLLWEHDTVQFLIGMLQMFSA